MGHHNRAHGFRGHLRILRGVPAKEQVLALAILLPEDLLFSKPDLKYNCCVTLQLRWRRLRAAPYDRRQKAEKRAPRQVSRRKLAKTRYSFYLLTTALVGILSLVNGRRSSNAAGALRVSLEKAKVTSGGQPVLAKRARQIRVCPHLLTASDRRFNGLAAGRVGVEAPADHATVLAG